MGLADWVIVAVLIVTIVHAATQGFFHEAFGVAGLVIGYILAAWQYRRVAGWFLPYVNAQWLADIAGYLIIFVGVLILAGIAGRITRWAVKEAGLSFFDRALGAVLGLAKGCLIVAIVLMGLAAFTPTSRWLQGSQLAPYFLVVGRAAIWVAPSELRARFYQGLALLRQGAQATEANDGRSGSRK